MPGVIRTREMCAAGVGLVAAVVLSGCRTDLFGGGDEDELAEPISEVLAVPLATTPTFSKCSARGKKITVALVGDILLHGPLQKQAVHFRRSDRFRSLWKKVESNLSGADITYANLEGATAKGIACNGKVVRDPGLSYSGPCKKRHAGVYTSYSRFNYHPSLISDLKKSGFDVVSTSNNHTLDRGWRGVDRTITALREHNMKFTGTRSSKEVRSAPWHTITEAKGVRVAWLACAYGMNGHRDKHGKDGQVLTCYRNSRANPKVLSEIKSLYARSDVDAVIVTPHWGQEERGNSQGIQERAARR